MAYEDIWNSIASGNIQYTHQAGGGSSGGGGGGGGSSGGGGGGGSSGGGGGGGGSRQISEYEQQIIDYYRETSGFERTRLAAEIAERSADREQSAEQFAATMRLRRQMLELDRERLKIEEGSAYADAWYKEQQVRLAGEAHMLEASRVGLSYIQAAIEYASSPDTYWQLKDFQAMSQRVLAGQQTPIYGMGPGFQPAPQNIMDLTQQLGLGSAWSERATSPEQWSPPAGGAFAGFPEGMQPDRPEVQTGGARGTAASDYDNDPADQPGYRGASARSRGGGDNDRADVRTRAKAAKRGETPLMGSAADLAAGVARQGGTPASQAPAAGMIALQNFVSANPPSNQAGWSADDIAALNQIGEWYANPQQLPPGFLEAMGEDQRKLTYGGIKRLGGSAQRFLEQYARSRPTQGSATAA